MIRLLEMFGGVLVFGGIATPHMATFKADPQVHPCIANAQAILATTGGGLHVTDLVQMAANGWHWRVLHSEGFNSTQDSFSAVVRLPGSRLPSQPSPPQPSGINTLYMSDKTRVALVRSGLCWTLQKGV
jgi:hypothetical protein